MAIIWIKRLITLALVLGFSAFVVLFTLRNNALVDIDLLFVYFDQVKIELALVASFIIGGLLGMLSILPLWYSIRKKYRVQLAKAQDLQEGQ
jgi:uncharacterized integral membrane protein